MSITLINAEKSLEKVWPLMSEGRTFYVWIGPGRFSVQVCGDKIEEIVDRLRGARVRAKADPNYHIDGTFDGVPVTIVLSEREYALTKLGKAEAANA